MTEIYIFKDRNNNHYVQAGVYKVRVADGTRHDGTTIGQFELVKKLTTPDVPKRNWFQKLELHWRLLYYWIFGILIGLLLPYAW